MTGVSLLLRLLGGGALAVFVWEVDAGLAGGTANWLNLSIAVGSGFLLGILVTPDVTMKPLLRLRERLTASPDDQLMGITGGLFTGLVLAALLAVPLAQLPGSFGRLLPLALALLFAYFGATIGLSRGAVLARRLGVDQNGAVSTLRRIIVDSSAIIDGRLPAIWRAGFLRGPLVVPEFVVAELQGLADSSNATVRARGRRGLDILLELRHGAGPELEILAWEDPAVPTVDGKLVAMAQAMAAILLTNDANLARVAELQRIPVISIHALTLAVRQQLTPGEQARVRIVQEGSEPRQGRAYLPDGTLIVVEGGRAFLGQDLDVIIQRAVQTPQGRLLFAQPAPAEAETVR
ncbi:MAG TPA: PIN domain-containing protein [Chloroflexota bacterium]|nr:PIN domain-containing protein [Chloroflexota bacterium]